MLVIHILFYIVAFLLFVYPLGTAYITGNRWLNHKALHKQPVFWVAVMWPTSAFLLFGSEVWFSYELSTTEAGYAKFLDISKLPLGILASGLAAAAFVASIHRSIQTAKQIEEAKVKNTADLYYAHKKFFFDQVTTAGLINNPTSYYKKKYPHMRVDNYNPKPSLSFIQKYKAELGNEKRLSNALNLQHNFPSEREAIVQSIQILNAAIVYYQSHGVKENRSDSISYIDDIEQLNSLFKAYKELTQVLASINAAPCLSDSQSALIKEQLSKISETIYIVDKKATYTLSIFID